MRSLQAGAAVATILTLVLVLWPRATEIPVRVCEPDGSPARAVTVLDHDGRWRTPDDRGLFLVPARLAGTRLRAFDATLRQTSRGTHQLVAGIGVNEFVLDAR